LLKGTVLFGAGITVGIVGGAIVGFGFGFGTAVIFMEELKKNDDGNNVDAEATAVEEPLRVLPP
jgi:hypothetical protein